MPHGFDLEAPSFGYWFRAGAALALGAATVLASVAIAWTVFGLAILRAYALHAVR